MGASIPMFRMENSLDVKDSDGPARRNVLVLVAAQAILGAQMPMIFVVAGLAGKQLAPNACLATLPISLMVIGSMLSANPMSAIMARYGRRAGFVLGTCGGALGGGVAAYGLSIASFPLFLIGAFLSGIYQSSQGFFRFAAADTASPAFRPKAISWVMAGGLLSAVQCFEREFLREPHGLRHFASSCGSLWQRRRDTPRRSRRHVPSMD